MIEINRALFDELRSLDLPASEYVVVASGPLGIRNLRAMGDIDILVSDNLWAELETKYDKVYDHEAYKIRISPSVEAFCGSSFGPGIPGSPTAAEQIAQSELIEGLPIQNINTALFFKKRGGRDKDMRDVELIETWLRENT